MKIESMKSSDSSDNFGVFRLRIECELVVLLVKEGRCDFLLGVSAGVGQVAVNPEYESRDQLSGEVVVGGTALAIT